MYVPKKWTVYLFSINIVIEIDKTHTQKTTQHVVRLSEHYEPIWTTILAPKFRGRAEKVVVQMHWLTWLLWRPWSYLKMHRKITNVCTQIMMWFFPLSEFFGINQKLGINIKVYVCGYIWYNKIMYYENSCNRVYPKMAL